MSYSQDKEIAIAITKRMKAADKERQRDCCLDGGEWAKYAPTPRGGAKWTEAELDDVVDMINDIVDMKQGQKFSYDDMSFVAWSFGRSSAAVSEKLRAVRPRTMKLFWFPV